MGVMRAGFVPFPISNRNSPAAVADLLKSTKSMYWYTTTDPATQQAVDGALAQLAESERPKMLTAPWYGDLYNEAVFAKELLPPLPPVTNDIEHAGVILHSSGKPATNGLCVMPCK
jgi:subtilisin family serine protease